MKKKRLASVLFTLFLGFFLSSGGCPTYPESRADTGSNHQGAPQLPR